MKSRINCDSFVGDNPYDVITNISWDLNKSLSEAYLFLNKDYNNENIVRFGDNNKIYKILGNKILIPKTCKFVINLSSDQNDPLDIEFYTS